MPNRSIKFADLTLRDGQQSLAATRMTTDQALSVLPMIDKAGYSAIELWGGATLDSCVRYLDEDPWQRLDRFSDVLSDTDKFRVLLRGQNLFAYQPYPDDLVIAFVKEAVRSGARLMRIFDALNDERNLQMPLLATKAYGGEVEAALSYTVSPVHTVDYYAELAQSLEDEGADRIAIKDMAGLLQPNRAGELFSALKSSVSIPITFHSHTTTGVATLNAVLAMHAGIDTIDTAITPFAGGPSHPPVEVLIPFADAMGLTHNLDRSLIPEIQRRLFKIFQQLDDHIAAYAATYRPVAYEDVPAKAIEFILERVMRGSEKDLDQALQRMRTLLQSLGYPPYDARILESQIPGGMISNLNSQLKTMGQLDRLPDILKEVPAVRADVGYVPLVTPTSQIVGSQATFNVLMGRYQMVSNEFKMLLRGEFGHTPAVPSREVVARVLEPGEEPLKYRPASYLSPALEDNHHQPWIRTHRDLLLHLMLKQSADTFLKRKYGISET
jgi:pyruvate/oxaloacetate carboxyltransferase